MKLLMVPAEESDTTKYIGEFCIYIPGTIHHHLQLANDTKNEWKWIQKDQYAVAIFRSWSKGVYTQVNFSSVFSVVYQVA